MRKKIKQLLKQSLAGLTAFVMTLGSLPVTSLQVYAAEAETIPVSNFTSRFADEIVLENTGGDNLVLLQSLSPEDEFVFGADVTFSNPDEQQSAALIFGIKDRNLDDGHAIKANIHKKIDWNVPARVWGYGTDELKCPGENGQANRYFEDNGIDVAQKFRMEVSVQKNDENQYVMIYSLTNSGGEKVTMAQGILNDSYNGGRFGLMTFASRAVFSNITVDGQKYGALESTSDSQNVYGVNGDAHTVSDVMLEGGKEFTYETDINLAADTCSAALTFGIRNPENPGEAWIGANFNFNDNGGAGGARVFMVNYGAGDIGSANLEGKLDRSRTIHAKLHVSSKGNVTYELYNTDNAENKVTVTGTLQDYTGGYLGLLTFDSSAKFSNTTCTVETDSNVPEETEPDATEPEVTEPEVTEPEVTEPEVTEPEVSPYHTNLGELTYVSGNGFWEVRENGLYSDATGQGDSFAFSQVQGTNFVYSTDLDFDGTEGAAALVFRSNKELGNHESYAVNIDVGSHTCKFWRWQKGEALQLVDIKSISATADEKYTLKVVAFDSWILYYVNDQLIASTGDYVLQPGNLGQNTVIKDGYFGILNWNSKVTFQNTYYKELSGDFNPLLTDISVTSSVGTVEEKTQFTPTEPITLQYVKNNASAVNIVATPASGSTVVEVMDANGNVYEGGYDIPVKEGSNYITVTSTVTDEDGMSATMTYRVNVHRFKADAVYYNEAFRDQYHYSVKEGWANDPNGLVYFNGTYHMFYQFYDDIEWGPMHWAHATSNDLIHWEEEPIALYPDANGVMFSGCMVIDANNTSGFFDGIPGGGLVALITADGNGQRIKLAYSTDEGKTWTKVDEIVADWTDDPLRDAAFRDPKVFRWEGKWFMVVAGGPLRIYSSDNLREWKCEAVYADLHTECPDLYPIQAPDGQLKWVLSRGGRFYKVGDFKVVDGSWRFVPDADYVNSDGVMNFGRDFYAAMTYYIQDFGTVANPTLPELVELNWMNTWDDYCNQVAEVAGKDFNGTFNLNLKLGLKKDGSKYVLTQTPISGYESLRDNANKQEWTGVTVEPNSVLLQDFVGDTYEIIAKFYPEEGTKKVGFKVRTGEKQETLVIYDLESQRMSIDRSRSGVIISSKFAETTSQSVNVNADGSVDMHIYVDKASVEAFAMDHTVAGSVQIFPSPVSVGAQVFVEGIPAMADITIYPLNSIWTNKAVVTNPQYVGTTLATSQNMYVGDTLKLTAYVLPTTVSQALTWTVKEGNDVVQIDGSGTVTAFEEGTAVIVAASTVNPALTKEFTIQVTQNSFNTNISEFVSINGNWHIDGETLSVSNGGQNDYYMSAAPMEGDFTLETDICYTKGLINLFLAAENQNPHEGYGAYTVQFGYDTSVRLFPFGKDDFASGTMENPINDGAYHHVKIVKEDRTVAVYVDEVKCLEHTFDTVEAFFENGHVGIGLWDGALDIQNFFVMPIASEPESFAITKQPEDVSATLGESFCVEVIATGEGLKYQWYFRNEGATKWNKSGVTDNTYDDVMTQARANREVYCVITDAYGEKLQTDTVKIMLGHRDLVILSQPNNASAKLTEKFCVSVTAYGDGLKYQWYWRDMGSEEWHVSGQRDNTYDDIMTSARHNREVKCIITDAWGNTAETSIATITGEETVKLAITRQPESQTVKMGEMFNVTFDAVGDALKYQWYFRNQGDEQWYKSAQKDNSYDDVMTKPRHSRSLYCIVTDAWGNTVTTDPVVVITATRANELAILVQPEDTSAKLGENFCVTMEAQGDEVKYQWYYRSVGSENWYISGQRDNTYDDVMTKARHNRQVKCVITDMWGNSVESDVATITATVSQPLTVINQPADVSAANGENFCVTVEAQGDGLTYTWYFRNAGSKTWNKSGVKDNTYDDVMTDSRAGRQVYCVVADILGNTVTTDTVTLIRQ